MVGEKIGEKIVREKKSARKGAKKGARRRDAMAGGREKRTGRRKGRREEKEGKGEEVQEQEIQEFQESARGVKKKQSMKSRVLVAIGPLILAGTVLLDQAVKLLAAALPLNERVAIVPGMFWFTHVRNTGVSFSMFTGNNALLIWVAVAILGLLVWAHDQFRTGVQRAAYWLILGGLFGNLLDRILRGSVVDMFDLGWWPVFNVADSAICVAVAILIIEEIVRLARKSKA